MRKIYFSTVEKKSKDAPKEFRSPGSGHIPGPGPGRSGSGPSLARPIKHLGEMWRLGEIRESIALLRKKHIIGVLVRIPLNCSGLMSFFSCTKRARYHREGAFRAPPTGATGLFSGWTTTDATTKSAGVASGYGERPCLCQLGWADNLLGNHSRGP